jgi:hypothetical protein
MIAWQWKPLSAFLSLVVAAGLFVTCPLQAEDIPEKGSSFFDSMQDTIGIHYDGRPLPKEPHPFEDLLRKLNQHSTFFASVVPFGRSLQKMAAYPQSSKFPRLMVATSELSKTINTHFRGRLFIAYVEPAKKLEIISFNPILGRFEFQIVDNFHPGGKAQVRYAPRSLCLRCHQGGTPIFAGGEWLETTAFNPALRELSEAAIGSKEYFGIPLSRDDNSSKFDLLPRAEHFEDMVRFGALLVGYQKGWQDICSLSRNQVDCKRKLLLWMLTTNLADKLSLEPDLDLLRGFVSVLGDGTIRVPSEKLPDHNPVLNGKLSYHMPPEIDPSLPREPMQIIMASRNDPPGLQFYKFHIFVKSMGQSYFTEKDFAHFRSLLGGNPAERSYEVTYQNQSYAFKQRESDKVCLPDPADLHKGMNAKEATRIPMRFRCFPKASWTRFAKAVNSLTFAKDDPLSRELVLQELDKKLGTHHAVNLCCKNRAKSVAKAEVEKTSVLDPDSIKDHRLQKFFKYCSECHLYQDLPYPFLSGESESLVLQSIRNRAQLIEFRLQNNQMPPQFARHPLHAKERQELLQTLKEIAK